MKTYLRNLIETVSQSLWLMPSISISLALVAAYLMLKWERAIDSGWEQLSFVLRSGPEASLAIVGTLVGSLITVAGVTFSITIVSLTLASSQFGPRLLRNFLQSNASQLTLGALVGSFVYGVLIMPGIGEDWQVGEAHPSVMLMIALACFCVCMIVYYIHHVATSIQADALVAAVYEELEQRIESLPERSGRVLERAAPNWAGKSIKILSHRSGYVTAASCEGALSWAKECNLQVRFMKRAGKFVSKGEVLVEVFGDVDKADAIDKVKEVVFIGSKRTPEQDLEFLVDQLVEVAMRAISPGINDPNTALVCIDYLGASIRLLSDRELPRCYYTDTDDKPRIYCPQTDYEGLVNDSFDQLRQSGRDYPEIVMRLMESLTSIVASLPLNDPRRKASQNQFEQLVEGHRFSEGIATKDKSDIQRCVECFERTLDSRPV